MRHQLELTLPLEGQRITMMSFDVYSPYLRLHARYKDKPHVELSIDTRLAIHHADRVEDFDLPTEMGAAAAALVPLLGQEATVARAHEDGTLRIELDGGAKLIVVSHPQYQAWQVVRRRCISRGIAGRWLGELGT